MEKMSKEMENEFLDLVEKNLPKQMGESLLARFNELEEVESDLKISKDSNRMLREAQAKLNEKLGSVTKELEEVQIELEDFKAKELELLRRENNVRFVELEKQLSHERLFDYKEMMLTIFKNTTVRKNVFVNETNNTTPNGCYDNNGNPMVDKSKNTDTNETITEE